MKKRRKRRVCNLNPRSILVGYHGKIRHDNRLLPLRMTRKYKNFLEQEESDRRAKISEMSELIQKHENLVSIMTSLRKENKNNSNSSLLLELEEKRKMCRNHLLHLESKLDRLPENIHESMKDIFNRNSRNKKTTRTYKPLKRRKNTASIVYSSKKLVQTGKDSKLQKSLEDQQAQCKRYDVANRNSQFACVKSQIFVRDCNSQLRTISIDLFSNGENLVHVLATELGNTVKSFNVMFGTKQVDKEKTLWEQNIFHGSTVHLTGHLHGGGGKRKKKEIKRKESTNKSDNPELWTQDQVAEWIDKTCEEYKIDQQEFSKLKLFPGKALNMLEKEDFKEYSPNFGIFLFRIWNGLKKHSDVDTQSDTNKEELTDAARLDEDGSTLVEKNEEKPPVDEKSSEPHTEKNNVYSEVDDSAKKGLFCKVHHLSDMGDAIPLYDLVNDKKSAVPEDGKTICISGVCKGQPRRIPGGWTLFIRDDPPGAVNVFNKLRVDLLGSNKNEKLQSRTVEALLKKISSGVRVAARGRVKILEGDEQDSNKGGYEILKFKVVIDSDYHDFVYMESHCPPVPTRQLSQPWYVQQGVFPCVVDDKECNFGDVLQKTSSRVFCESTVSKDEIKKNAIAFKNSCDGDIFVGVDKSGEITGMKFSEGELLKWREDIAKVIGQILPETDQEVSICSTLKDATECLGKTSMVSVMRLANSGEIDPQQVKVMAWIHVPKGTAPVYFSKPTDVHAFIRVGAENRRISDYADLFSRLESLSCRRIGDPEDDESFIEQLCEDAAEMDKISGNCTIFKGTKYETDNCEFKMILGDKPAEIIERNYLSQYLCGFLNSSGGTIFFGVEEDKTSKLGHIVGIVISREERKELIRKSATMLAKFYPPVSTSQLRVKFCRVLVSSEHNILKYHKTDVARNGKCVILQGPAEEIQSKWPKFVKDKLPGRLCSVIRVKPQCFSIVAQNPGPVSEQFVEDIEVFTKVNTKFTLAQMDENELIPVFQDLCVAEFQVDRSLYPIHMTKPIETFTFDESGLLNKLSTQKLMFRFDLNLRSKFEVMKFLGHVNNFDPSGNSYILISSPFEFRDTERDLYGLVIPKWALVIDFDQYLKRAGHLYKIFEELHDRHQTERNRFVRTPLDHKLDLNPDHGVCWLAARGYDEIAESLCEESHGEWNISHRGPLRSLLEAELTRCVKPNLLNVVVLWEEGYEELVDSLHAILEDILSINKERTTLTLVCSTRKAQTEISNELVERLQKNYWKIIKVECVYITPPYVLAQHLASKLPDPYRPEEDYQVPHKKNIRLDSQIVPDSLPQKLRQNVHGHLEIMYISKKRKLNKDVLRKERKLFYSGSEITNLGLQGEIGINRSKIDPLEEEFTVLLGDKKSNVSLIVIKADRGAGTTTMCLQFLFQHHEEYPCARLIEVRHGLVSHIEDITKVTKLPLLLFVDEEIAHLPDFLEFKNDLERRSINVFLLLVEPGETYIAKPTSSRRRRAHKPRMKSVMSSSLYGTSPHKVLELRRELEEKEMEELTAKLIAVDEEKENELLKLKNQAKHQKTLRTFAHFSLTAFGNEFSGLKDYVEFRLSLASETQKDVLTFLSLTHVFTDYLFPASALAGFLDKKRVELDAEFENSYVRELLSPPVEENDSRRTSFVEVAQEILKQLSVETPSTDRPDSYWLFIKHASVKMAKDVLSVNISTKKIDRLTRRLFVTSEYESAKFSFLIRSMKDEYCDIARDTLIELVEVFRKHTSFRAHLLAHLAKYHMTVYEDFEKAKPLIEEAIKDQPDDPLLHHIHGDIIRRHVQALKESNLADMSEIVSHAVESSVCFEFVRKKRPRVSHGYLSDVLVRISVMQAAIKEMRGSESSSFVDYLIQKIDDIKERGGKILGNERYLLSMIPDTHRYLDQGVIDFGSKEKWKHEFVKCIGDLRKLEKLYEKLNSEKSFFSGSSSWLHEVSIETKVLYNVLEIETKDLSPAELEIRIKYIEECGSSSKLGEQAMKYWIRYSRNCEKVPTLEEVKGRVEKWVYKAKKRGGKSPLADFYNYVVNVLAALKDPNDREKMKKAKKLIKSQQVKKHSRKEDVNLPLEWLHPKERHHINSIDSLLHHDDLVKEKSRFAERGKLGKEKAIEVFLFQRNVTKWEGIVKEIKNDWHGTIVFKRYLDVRFIPQDVPPSMPRTGDTVMFCLSFDVDGLHARCVTHPAGYSRSKNLLKVTNSDGESSSDEEEVDEETVIASTSLFTLDVPEETSKFWVDFAGKRMQGVVLFINSDNELGGYLGHPDVSGKLYFRASQLVNPVTSLEVTVMKYMVLEFKVEQLPERTRADDIRLLKEEDICPEVQKYANNLKRRHSPPSTRRREKESDILVKTEVTRGREEGVIVRLSGGNAYGFIKPDNSSYEKEIFFHRNFLANKDTVLEIGDRVQFLVRKTEKGFQANDIFVQSKSSAISKWSDFVGRGIQEGYISSITNDKGTISSAKIAGNLPFYIRNIRNQQIAVRGANVHFKVEKRGGKCTAVDIIVISPPRAMIVPPLASHRPAMMPLPFQLDFAGYYPRTYESYHGDVYDDLDQMGGQ